MRRHAKSAARLLRSIGNPQRLLLLCSLAEGERSVAELNRDVELSQSALSQHLAVLRAARIVTTRREAQQIFYALAPGPAAAVMQRLYEIYCKPEIRKV